MSSVQFPHFTLPKLKVMNALKSYFNRSWTRQDLMNSGTIPEHAHIILKKVYHTLFSAMFCATVGSNIHLYLKVGGLISFQAFVTSSLCLYSTSPQRVYLRFMLLMSAAYYFGASVGLVTRNLFEIRQVLVAGFFTDATLGVAIFSIGALITRERSDIYLGCLLVSCFLIVARLLAFSINFYITGRYTAHWMFEAIFVQTVFPGYLVVYSQEILYNAHSGQIEDIVACTLNIFFNLPAIVVHAARELCVGE